MSPPLLKDQRSYHQSIREEVSTQGVPRGDEPSGSLARVGLVGCGRMGRAIGGHLLQAGWPLTVTDVDPEAVRPLVAHGASPADDPGSVAGASDLILVVVVDDEQVRRVIEGAGGVMDAAGQGVVIAICSSVRPDTCRSSAALGATRDVEVIDVALVRGERGAEAGELLLLCGGAEATIDRCRAVFAAFATDVVRVGDIGSGQVAKAANNILLWACLRADLEALRLGRALGVEPATLRSVLALGSGANRPLAEWGEHRLRWPAKDLESAAQLAEEVGVDARLVETLGPLMAEVTAEDLRELL
jgi:3-hydroxyisobutyrate dehydrogenase-like beta-hydroxyacid dehydrogenase